MPAPLLRFVRLHKVTALLCLVSGLVWGLLWFGGANEAVPDSWLFPLRRFEWLVQDMIVRRGTPAPVDDRLVYLGIDSPNYADRFSEEEIAAEPVLGMLTHNYPWSRAVWAAAVDKLVAAGARVVAFDLLFISPGPGDEAFQAALNRHPGRVVLAANLNVAEGDASAGSALLWPSETLLGGLVQPEKAVGVVNFFPDADGVIRRVMYQLPLLTGTQASFSGQVLAAAGLPMAAGRDASQEGVKRFFFGGPPGTYAHRSVYEIFVPSLWQHNFKNGEFFKGKIVVVGPAANWTQDHHPTPQGGLMFGAEVHLHAMAAALHGAFIQEASPTQALLLVAAATLLAFALMAGLENPWWRVAAMAGVSLGWVALAQALYGQSWLIVTVAPLLTFNTSCALSLVQRFFSTLVEKLRTRAMLERYVSQNFVREILDHTASFEESLGGVRKDCTMLFSDIRGFTTLTEGADSHAVVTQLNEYLGEMVDCVFKREGTLDKFMGDAVMAVWGNVRVRTPRHYAVDAVHCALDMLAALDRLNADWKTRGLPVWRIGIGINHGEVIVGNMGAPRRKEFTVIGDPVNLASRLEGVTKEYGLTLVLGETVAGLVAEEFILQPVDLIRVKGKQRPVAVFTVLATKAAGVSAPVAAALARYGAGLDAYRQGRFAEALAEFKASLARAELNSLAALYVTRCEALLAQPPEGDWDGVFVMRLK